MLENAAGSYSVAERQKALETLDIYFNQMIETNIFSKHQRLVTREDIRRDLKCDRHFKSSEGRLQTWKRWKSGSTIGEILYLLNQRRVDNYV